MNNIRLATLVSLVTLSILPATSAFALPIDFDDSTKIKLIEVGIDALKSTNKSSETKTETTPAVLEKTPSTGTETEVAETEVAETETTAQITPIKTLETSIQTTQPQQIQCAQVQQQCLEVSYSTRSIGVYQGGTLQQTLPLVNGQAVYNVPTSGVSIPTTYPAQTTYPSQQPLGYPQPMQPVYGVSPIVQPVYAAPSNHPGVYGYPNVYSQPVYNPNIQSVYGSPAPFVQAVPRVSPQQQEVMVINVEPKAEAQTIILDRAYPAQGR